MELVSDSAEERRIAELIAPALAGLGFDLVRVALTGGGRRRLQVMLDRLDGGRVRLDDCTLASRTLSALLDVEDPIPGAYELEVSSPGTERPLTRAKDFERFAGHEARLELKSPRDGRRRFRGRLLGVAGDAVRIEEEGQEFALPLAAILRARLVAEEKPAGGRRTERTRKGR